MNTMTMRFGKVSRFVALILGLLVSVFYTFYLIFQAVADVAEGKTAVIPLLLLMIASVAGYIWAVTAPLKGAMLMIAGGLAMAIYLLFMGGIGEIGMALIFGMPFIIPGLLFYVFARGKK